MLLAVHQVPVRLVPQVVLAVRVLLHTRVALLD
jgi:hypothetical protein